MAGEDDRVVGGPDGGELGGTHCCSAGLFEVEHSMPGIGEQRDHVGGPALPSDFGYAVQFAEMVSIAQGVADVGVLAIRGPAVMNQDATQVFEHPHRVHGHRAPPLVEVIERERGGRYRMDPVQRCLAPHAGFVCVGEAVDTEWTQYSDASTRRPVSSAWATSAWDSWPRSEARKASSRFAPSCTMATIVPVDTGIP